VRRERGDRVGARTSETALEKALSDTEWQLRKASYAASHGERLDAPDPRYPNPIEQTYIDAAQAFRARRMTRGFDLIERADFRAMLRRGRGLRRPIRERGDRDAPRTHRGNADLIRWYLKHAHEADRQLFGGNLSERRRVARATTAKNVKVLRRVDRVKAIDFVRSLGYRG
jgi:hypothetical protein